MNFQPTEPARSFFVGSAKNIELKDCARVQLEANEQITLVTSEGKEWDIARKEWGYYATPSINGRLKSFGFKTALVQSHRDGRLYIMLVENDKVALFESYLKQEDLSVVEWLDQAKSI